MLSDLKRRERKREWLFTSAVCMLASCPRWYNWECPADVAWLYHVCKSVVTKSIGCSFRWSSGSWIVVFSFLTH